MTIFEPLLSRRVLELAFEAVIFAIQKKHGKNALFPLDWVCKAISSIVGKTSSVSTHREVQRGFR
jgi:hypothetical protein